MDDQAIPFNSQLTFGTIPKVLYKLDLRLSLTSSTSPSRAGFTIGSTSFEKSVQSFPISEDDFKHSIAQHIAFTERHSCAPSKFISLYNTKDLAEIEAKTFGADWESGLVRIYAVSTTKLMELKTPVVRGRERFSVWKRRTHFDQLEQVSAVEVEPGSEWGGEYLVWGHVPKEAVIGSWGAGEKFMEDRQGNCTKHTAETLEVVEGAKQRMLELGLTVTTTIDGDMPKSGAGINNVGSPRSNRLRLGIPSNSLMRMRISHHRDSRARFHSHKRPQSPIDLTGSSDQTHKGLNDAISWPRISLSSLEQHTRIPSNINGPKQPTAYVDWTGEEDGSAGKQERSFVKRSIAQSAAAFATATEFDELEKRDVTDLRHSLPSASQTSLIVPYSTSSFAAIDKKPSVFYFPLNRVGGAYPVDPNYYRPRPRPVIQHPGAYISPIANIIARNAQAQQERVKTYKSPFGSAPMELDGLHSASNPGTGNGASKIVMDIGSSIVPPEKNISTSGLKVTNASTNSTAKAHNLPLFSTGNTAAEQALRIFGTQVAQNRYPSRTLPTRSQSPALIRPRSTSNRSSQAPRSQGNTEVPRRPSYSALSVMSTHIYTPSPANQGALSDITTTSHFTEVRPGTAKSSAPGEQATYSSAITAAPVAEKRPASPSPITAAPPKKKRSTLPTVAPTREYKATFVESLLNNQGVQLAKEAAEAEQKITVNEHKEDVVGGEK